MSSEVSFSIIDGQHIDAQKYGGKAAGLGRLKQLGLHIPPTVVVSTDFKSDSYSAITSLFEFCRNHFSPAEEWIVRSSAVGEDSADHSFAGQFDSIRTQPNLEAFKKAVLEVYQSYLEYADHTNLFGMSLVIQPFFAAKLFGVSFTRDPVDPNQGGRMEFVVEDGEQLVSGNIEPATALFTKQQGFFSESGNKDYLLAFNKYQFLLKKHVEQITALSLETELDFEWVINENEEFHYLQMRPITTLKLWNPRIYTNVNINENFPDAVSPLLYSIVHRSYYHYFSGLATHLGVPTSRIELAKSKLQDSVALIGCKLYYNLSNIHQAMLQLPFAKHWIQSFDSFVGRYDEGWSTLATGNQKESEIGFFAKLNMARIAIRNLRSAEFYVSRFESRANQLFGKMPTSAKEAQRTFFEFLEFRFHFWWNGSIADLSALISYALLGKFLKDWARNPSLREGLMSDVSNVISVRPAMDLRKIQTEIHKDPVLLDYFLETEAEELYRHLPRKFPKCWEQIQQYIEDWGFRCSGELQIENPTFIERPELLLAIIKNTLKHGPPTEHQDVHSKLYQQAYSELKTSIYQRNAALGFFKLLVLRKVIAWAHQSVRWRERIRLKQAMIYSRLRRSVYEIGTELATCGVLGKQSDIFYLTYSEITQILSRSYPQLNTLKSIVVERRNKHNVIENLPEELNVDLLYPLSSPPSLDTATEITESGLYRGVIANRGKVTGKVRVLENLMQANLLEPGEILVTRQTDPGWAPIFPVITGLIIERGGLLSHGAIVAREFGIPALVGVKGITRSLQSGQLVELDAINGSIKLLEAQNDKTRAH